ncbi:MAG: preprotein translocase subunit SecE [Candidatus Omnitrophica bacterium CG11_big_fil_rev_8_21_14_0_20_64_10]|nr:MAG: preprotein translocase subunit SecE [Candidatus Omnitrophica bacterium CG11_big_fil_rev_8_21_14_0_20_64_10]
MFEGAVRYLKDVRGEMGQVSWPPARELSSSTRLVLATVAGTAVVIGLFDLLFAQVMRWIIR